MVKVKDSRTKTGIRRSIEVGRFYRNLRARVQGTVVYSKLLYSGLASKQFLVSLCAPLGVLAIGMNGRAPLLTPITRMTARTTWGAHP